MCPLLLIKTCLFQSNGRNTDSMGSRATEQDGPDGGIIPWDDCPFRGVNEDLISDLYPYISYNGHVWI